MHEKRYNKAPSRIAKRQRAKKYFSLFLKIASVIIVLGGSFLILKADFLQIKKIEVLGTENIPSENLENAVTNLISGTKFLVVPKSNIIFLSKEKLAANLLSSFNGLEKIEINKKILSKNLEITVKERRAEFLWCAQDKCFFMTKEGLVFEPQSDLFVPASQLIFRGRLGEDPLMKNFATAEEMQNYLNLIEVFKSYGFEISSVNLESADRAVAKSNIGDIVFNPGEANLSSAAENAVLLIKEIKGKNPSARFQYIDARFGNKIFYKLI